MLIADSGSSKTDWHLCGPDTDFSWQTGGMHPYFCDRQGVSRELKESWPEGERMESVAQVFFYGSGCLKPKGADIVRRFLCEQFRNDVFVYSDLEGAAISTLGNRPGIAAILGTGSSAAFWDGKNLSRVSLSLGYLIGDEGSGSDIGKHLLREIMHREVEEELRSRFFKRYPSSPTDIISRLYSHPEPASYLASYAHFLSQNLSHPYCIQLLQNRFSAFIHRHLIPLQNEGICAVGFNGSIAFAFQVVLKPVLNQAGFSDITILKSPIDALVQHHKNEKGW